MVKSKINNNKVLTQGGDTQDLVIKCESPVINLVGQYQVNSFDLKIRFPSEAVRMSWYNVLVKTLESPDYSLGRPRKVGWGGPIGTKKNALGIRIRTTPRVPTRRPNLGV